MAATFSWRFAPVSTTERGAPLWSTRRFIFAPRLPLSVGFLPVFSPPSGAGEFLESNSLPLPRDPTALFGIVLDHPIHQLLEDAHLPPPLETLVNHACGDPKPLPMDGLPLAATPKHVPDSVGDGSVGHPRPAAPLLTLVPLFGQVLLEFPPQRSWTVVCWSWVRRGYTNAKWRFPIRDFAFIMPIRGSVDPAYRWLSRSQQTTDNCDQVAWAPVS